MSTINSNFKVKNILEVLGTGTSTIAGPLTITGALAGVTTLTLSDQITSTVSTGAAPFVVASTTLVTNLAAQTAVTVTTNANLTGPITSVGNATSIASQTGTGSKFVMDTAPQFATQIGVGAAAAAANRIMLSGTTDATATAPTALFAHETVNAAATSYAALKTATILSTGTALTDAMGVWITPMTLLGTAAITNRYGLRIEDLTAGTNIYGAHLNLSAGANKYNLFCNGTAVNIMKGGLGIGNLDTSGMPGISLYINKDITGSVFAYGTASDGVIKSDVTSYAYYNFTYASTQAAAFTCANLFGHALVGYLGAGSTVNNTTGFSVDSTFAMGSTGNNYAFYTNYAKSVNAATNWAYYAAGTAPSFFGGTVRSLQIGVGAAPVVANRILSSGTTDGATAAPVGCLNSETLNAFATTSYDSFKSSIATSASAFTCVDVSDFRATAGSLGAGSSITNRYGFRCDDLIAATNNYGFYSNVSAGANKYNLYANGTAVNIMKGSLGIGSMTATAMNAISLAVRKTITGNVFAYSTYADGKIQSDVTSGAYYNYTVAQTAAAVFTCPTITGYILVGNTPGAGSTVNNTTGFSVDSSFAMGSTGNNYAFYTNQAKSVNAATNWAFYGVGTAPSMLNGTLTLSITGPVAGINFRNALNITGATTSVGTATNAVIQSDVTVVANAFSATTTTATAAFTLGTVRHYYSDVLGIGTGSIVNTFTGFEQALNFSATNSYSFRGLQARESGSPTTFASASITNVAVTSNVATITAANAYTVGQIVTVVCVTNTQLNRTVTIASASGTQFTYAITTSNVTSVADTGTVTVQRRYNCYMDGTANNYFAGNVGLGIATPTAWLHMYPGSAVAGTAPLKFTNGTLLTTAETGAVEFVTDKYYGTITTGAARKEFMQWDNAGTLGVRLKMTEGTGGFVGQATLVLGTVTITISGVTTSSRAFCQLVTPTGTLGAAVKAVCTTNTLTITSETAAIATQTLDVSTFNYFIVN